METHSEAFCTKAIRFSVRRGDEEVARAFLYLIFNEQHPEPYGLIEDVFVAEIERGKGVGNTLLGDLIVAAKELRCYKLVATSRHGRDRVHDLYCRLGFRDYGVEFRIDLSP